MDWALILEWTIKSVILVAILVTGFAYTTFLERRLLARIQVRVGPNRAGPFGFLQPAAAGTAHAQHQSMPPQPQVRRIKINCVDLAPANGRPGSGL